MARDRKAVAVERLVAADALAFDLAFGGIAGGFLATLAPGKGRNVGRVIIEDLLDRALCGRIGRAFNGFPEETHGPVSGHATRQINARAFAVRGLLGQ